MNLVIDIGNSSVKGAVYDGGQVIASLHWQDSFPEKLAELLNTHPDIRRAILSSVRKDDAGMTGVLEKTGVKLLILDDQTALPLRNRYRSADTLGKDRLAAAVGASARYPGKNLLIIDAGTAITIDFVSAEDDYLGGNISPGLTMRFRSLHEFTDNLPLVNTTDSSTLLGDDTESAICAGVVNGILFEIDEYINRQKLHYPDLVVIMTGGDALFFEKKLKNSIFVDLDLNLHGLHRILDYNVDR
jgi:type III pantothenate kinase